MSIQTRTLILPKSRRPLTYELERKAVKRLNLRVRGDGTVHLSIPKRTTVAEAEAFLRDLPHTYYEENNLHAFLVEQIKDYDACIAAIDAFLPYVDNWSTCDGWSPKVLKKHPEELLCKIREWMTSDALYTVRFGIGMLQRYFLDERFDPVYLDWVAAIRREEYYVRMMVAWYFATALAKQYEAALPYIEEGCLPLWTHNKAIQKAVESYRVSAEQKVYLKILRKTAVR